MIIDGQEWGVCITKTNVLHMVCDFETFEKNIKEGKIANDVDTHNERLGTVDQLYGNNKALTTHKMISGFHR